MRELTAETITDAVLDLTANDPNWPIKGLPSIRFDMQLSRESAADKTSGRVGSDPSAIPQRAAKNQNTQSAAPKQADS